MKYVVKVVVEKKKAVVKPFMFYFLCSTTEQDVDYINSSGTNTNSFMFAFILRVRTICDVVVM